jgi:aromatic-L-amino-acid decarboxylase
VDAAFAGTALVLDEYQWMIDGIEQVDSFVFNPHKWMFTNFDCSVYYVKDKDSLINTFTIQPEYLKTKTAGKVNDYRDWGIQLGRRFRALKLWFVIRNFGVSGIKEKIQNHIKLAK